MWLGCIVVEGDCLSIVKESASGISKREMIYCKIKLNHSKTLLEM
jgi:hypothetical protein